MVAPPRPAVLQRTPPSPPLVRRHAILYQVTEIGTFGGKSSDAYGLNDQGDVTGSADVPSGFSHLYLYKNHRLHDLGQANVSHSSVGQCINNRDQIAGETGDGRAFFWQRGNFHYINPMHGPHAYLNVGVAGINSNGIVAGTVDDSTFWIGYLWRGGRGRLFSHLRGQETRCDAISPHERWILWNGRNFLHSPHGLIPLNPNLPPKFSTLTLDAVNDTGEVAGSMSDKYGQVSLAIWISHTGKLRVLPSFASFPQGNVTAINANGSMVGQCSGASGKSHAFRDAQGIMLDLNDAIDPRSGWVLQNAAAINARGQIVGSGLHNGKARGFLLTPISRAAHHFARYSP